MSLLTLYSCKNPTIIQIDSAKQHITQPMRNKSIRLLKPSCMFTAPVSHVSTVASTAGSENVVEPLNFTGNQEKKWFSESTFMFMRP